MLTHSVKEAGQKKEKWGWRLDETGKGERVDKFEKRGE